MKDKRFGCRVCTMATLTVDISEDVANRIAEAARVRGLSVGELVTQSVEEKLRRDAEFREATNRVLQKNAALYERLS